MLYNHKIIYKSINLVSEHMPSIELQEKNSIVAKHPIHSKQTQFLRDEIKEYNETSDTKNAPKTGS